MVLVSVFVPREIRAQSLSKRLTSSEFRSAAVPTNPRVLALRVQFQKEDVDDAQTTGNGHFLLLPKDDPFDSVRSLDPLPHNRRYFEDQMLALRNYFLDASDSNLHIQYTVKPDGLNDAYTLGRRMSYYGDRFISQEQRDLRLAELFSDAVRVADSTDTIDFSTYDYVVIFHAGAGQDFSAADPTPNDVASRFVNLDLLRRWKNDPTYEGVPVNGGSNFVAGGVLVPETESQEVFDTFGFQVFTEIGLTGILASNFASQLGMPDLFNTATGTTAIGVFGLTDQGAVNGDGLIPVEPDPWTKIFMGWADPLVVRDTTLMDVPSKKTFGKSLILKLPISSEEYFLVENRQRDVIDNALSPYLLVRAIRDSNASTGEVRSDTLYAAGADRSIETGVITRVDEYDAGLPGTGLLIWHIDERIIREKQSDGSINADLRRRGVRVVEGSGSQEIGYRFVVGPFSVIDAGNDSDFFFQDNDLFKRFNRSDSVFFGSTSIPNSHGNDGVRSGIRIVDISRRQKVMRMSVRNDLLQRGFPRFTGDTFGQNSLTAGDIAGDGRDELIAVGQSGRIYAWTSDGASLFSNGATAVEYGLGGDSTIHPVALFAVMNDSCYVSPALADLDSDGKLDVIAGDKSGRMTAWKSTDADLDTFADTLFTYASGAAITTSPLVTPSRQIVFGNSAGRITALNATGQIVSEAMLGSLVTGLAWIGSDTIAFQTETSTGLYAALTGSVQTLVSGQANERNLSPLVGNFDGVNGSDLLVVSGDEIQYAVGSFGQFPIELEQPVRSPLSTGDMDGDGQLEIAVGGSNRVHVFNHNGSLQTNFPVTLDPRRPAGDLMSSVLLADIDDDQQVELIVGAPDGRVFAFSRNGTPVSGFPLSLGSGILSTPLVANLDKDGDIELAAVSENGFVSVWDLSGTYRAQYVKWGKALGDVANTSSNHETLTPVSTSTSLMPAKRVYNYPNPVRGDATTIRYYLSESAEIRIHIFDIAGHHVETLSGPGLALADNEVTWSTRRIQSGLYFAKVHAKSASGASVTRTIKIAVTR